MIIMEQTMKIAWLNEHILMWNGGVRFIYEVTKRLVKDDIQVEVIVSGASISNINKFNNIDVLSTTFSNASANQLKYWLLYPYYLISNSIFLKKLLKGYDTVISTSPTTDILCKLANIKPIIICFEPNPWLHNEEYIEGLSKFKQVLVRTAKPFMKPIEKRAYKNAKAVICHSKFVQSEIRRIYDIDSTVILVGVDIDKFKKAEVNPLYKEYKDYNVILHIASYLSPMKGTKYAIEAMRWIVNQVPNALLLIVTQDTKEAKLKLLKQSNYLSIAKASDISGHIQFITDATDDDMINYYSLAKVHLQPSLDENAHYPAIEAGCCECPTVGFNGKFECEDIVHNETGALVHWKDSKKLADCTILILKDNELRNRLGKNARQFMINKFSWDKYMSKFKEVINGN